MARKVFISFLGTSKYTECNYCSSSGLVEKNIAFVQEATIKHNCMDYDLFLFFLTKEAKLNNWDRENGLYSRLQLIEGVKDKVIAKDIPNGFNINEIWEIFQIIYDQIKNNDQLVFDITHAFRSLPMLGMVLINYLKAVKKVEINGIYYGAFEALGHPSIVNDMPMDKRNVEILDFIGFSLLQDWTTAANNFYEFGNVNKLTELISKEISPILKETKGDDIDANMLRSFIKPLPAIFENITTVRLQEIYKSKQYNDVKESIKKINKKNIPQVAPLIDKIYEKLIPFHEENSILNGFHIVKLCLDYGWIQQAYTILIETTVSYILESEKLDWKKEEYRNITNSCFTILKHNIQEESWTGDASKQPHLTKQLLNSPLVFLLNDDFIDLINCRNDINHAGIRKNPMAAKTLKLNIERIYCNLISKIL